MFLRKHISDFYGVWCQKGTRMAILLKYAHSTHKNHVFYIRESGRINEAKGKISSADF